MQSVRLITGRLQPRRRPMRVQTGCLRSQMLGVLGGTRTERTRPRLRVASGAGARDGAQMRAARELPLPRCLLRD